MQEGAVGFRLANIACGSIAALLLGLISAFAQSNAFLQRTEGTAQTLNQADNLQYLHAENHTSSLLVRAFVTDSAGNTTWFCKTKPSFVITFVPDTPYFVAMLNANLHSSKFVDGNANHGFYSVIDFVGLMHCSGDGFIRVDGLPPLPYIVFAKLPEGLSFTHGTYLAAHARLQPNKLTDIALTNENIVSSKDTITVGSGIDFSILRNVYRQLPTSSAEGVAATEALSAIDNHDLGAAVAATIRYVEICEKELKCAAYLDQTLKDEFKKNRGWFEFFGVLATAGLSFESSTAVRAASDEEIALSRIGQEFRAAAAESSNDTAGIALEISILRMAASDKGNFGFGTVIVSEVTAKRVGAAWVGPGYRVSSRSEDIWISADELRQFRLPSTKKTPLSPTGFQANLESRPISSDNWKNNGHLDVR